MLSAQFFDPGPWQILRERFDLDAVDAHRHRPLGVVTVDVDHVILEEYRQRYGTRSRRIVRALRVRHQHLVKKKERNEMNINQLNQLELNKLIFIFENIILKWNSINSAMARQCSYGIDR